MRVMEPITLMGVTLTQERFPNLLRRAQKNPEGLEAEIKALMEGTDAESAMVNLESDLAHG